MMVYYRKGHTGGRYSNCGPLQVVTACLISLKATTNESLEPTRQDSSSSDSDFEPVHVQAQETACTQPNGESRQLGAHEGNREWLTAF